MSAANSAMARAPRLRANGFNPQKVAATGPFWDCHLSRYEWALLAISSLLAAALHLGPVLHSGLGTLLVYALAGVSYLSPVTGFFFIACGQFVPFPEGSSHNPAQVGVLVWLPVVLLRYHRLKLDSAWRLWPVLPWLLWFVLLTGERVFLPNSEYMKALAYCLIACQLANESRGQFLKCLVGLCLGALLIMTAYWATQLGLPVEVNDWGGEREGFVRIGSVRADAVMVWPALLFGISGLLGSQIAFASRRSPAPSPAWLTYATVFLSAASLPPLISTMCHGALAGLGMVLVALAWAGWLAGKEGAFGSPRFRVLVRWEAVGVAAVLILFIVDAFQLRSRMFSLEEYYNAAAAETSVAASRTGVWHDSIHTIMKYPLLGIRMTGEQEEITSEYADQGGYLSHNVFLDYGRATGIPGILLCAYFFFWPAVAMWRSRALVRFLPFLLAHFAMFIFWMSLSFQFYKTFWALWMLMAVAVAPHPALAFERSRTKAPVKSRKTAQPSFPLPVPAPRVEGGDSSRL
jgi:O-antigen ligase